MYVYMCAHVLSPGRIFATPWTLACQGHLSMEISRQLYGLPFISPVYMCIYIYVYMCIYA